MCVNVCKGKCRWIRVPAIVYASHVATTLIPILYHVMVADFSDSHGQPSGPVTVSERLTLSAVYIPYLVVPLMLLYHMLTSADYLPGKAPSLKQH